MKKPGKIIKVGDMVIAEFQDGEKIACIVVEIAYYVYYFEGPKVYWWWKTLCTKLEQLQIEI